jgi:hypothetical protein
MSSTKINPTTNYQKQIRKSESKRRFTKLVPWHNLWKKGGKKDVKLKRQSTNKTNKKI